MNARRNVDPNTQRSAAIGLGLLGRLVSGDDRVQVAQVLLRSIEQDQGQQHQELRASSASRTS